MSNQINEQLLEQAGELLNLAAHYTEEFVGTTVSDVIVELVGHIAHDIDHDNLDDLYGISMPALQRVLDDCSVVLAQESQNEFNLMTDTY